MKKTYKAPLTEVVKLKVNELLQVTSPLGIGGSVPEGQGSGANVLSNDDDYEGFDPSLW